MGEAGSLQSSNPGDSLTGTRELVMHGPFCTVPMVRLLCSMAGDGFPDAILPTFSTDDAFHSSKAGSSKTGLSETEGFIARGAVQNSKILRYLQAPVQLWTRQPAQILGRIPHRKPLRHPRRVYLHPHKMKGKISRTRNSTPTSLAPVLARSPAPFLQSMLAPPSFAQGLCLMA